MSGRALEAAIDALHGVICGALVDELDRAIARARAAPEDPDCAINPQLLDKVMKFLAQNGVSAPRSTPKVDALAAQLADLDLDGEANQLRPH